MPRRKSGRSAVFVSPQLRALPVDEDAGVANAAVLRARIIRLNQQNETARRFIILLLSRFP
jgi:hypothetical protein